MHCHTYLHTLYFTVHHKNTCLKATIPPAVNSQQIIANWLLYLHYQLSNFTLQNTGGQTGNYFLCMNYFFPSRASRL